MRSIIVTAVLSVLLVGCASMQVEEDELAKFHETKPASILILPVVNKSVDVMASTSALTTLPKILGERGYYIFPVNTVKSLLESEGFADPQEIHDASTTKLADLFHADSVLYVVIHEWTSRYLVISTTTEVDLEYTLKNRNGEVIFNDRKTVEYTPESESSSNNDLLGDLISSAVSAAIERASPNYLPLTREANSQAFLYSSNPLPPGPYHPRFEAYYAEVLEKQAQAAAAESAAATQQTQ
jgi:hypothetical protein